jgi:hypothetical protein
MAHTYSKQRVGGIGYRLDFSNGTSYTTNPDGGGLFFHNGRGGRNQVSGNGQFSAGSMRQFQARTKNIVESVERQIAEAAAWAAMSPEQQTAAMAAQDARNESYDWFDAYR